MENPFRDELLTRQHPEPCTLVIFGATGDLTHKLLIPALYNLALDGELPPTLKVIAFARRPKGSEEIRAEYAETNRKHSRQGHNDEFWERFSQRIVYHRAEFGDANGYGSLRELLEQVDRDRGGPGNRLFYLASAPDDFEVILNHLREAALNVPRNGGWSRVIVEKPIGKDLESAQHLNTVVANVFDEEDTYRIDHYLGKETAQNIIVTRFGNSIFEPLWNRSYIDHVQVTCAENFGMTGGRGAYYDKAGALRDMVQNHLLQLVSLIAMEPPTDLRADSVRDEKVKVLRALRHFKTPAEVAQNVVRAQYEAGAVDGKPTVGYREEERVDPNSKTETYVALRVFIDTWRWQGVPFYIRVGKQLPKKATEISVHFRRAPHVLFQTLPARGRSNVLVFRIQPDEGVSLRMLSKVPGLAVRMEPVKMDFRYSTSFGKPSPLAYERLLLDAMAGDATLFARRDEVESAWRFIDVIEEAWHESGAPPPVAEYPAGSWGPSEADQLLERDGRTWRRI
ncbi:MAG: glucose-6-phosphate dehydrogenase [Verrucomicrobiales bacterium]